MIEVTVTANAPFLLGSDPVFPGQVVEVDETAIDVSMALETGNLSKKAKPPAKSALVKKAKGLGVKNAGKLGHNNLVEAISHAEGEAQAQEEHGIDFGDERL